MVLSNGIYGANKIIKIRISKINCMYQIIDKTFSVKNPPIYSDEFNPTRDFSKELDCLMGYLKSKYKNEKLDLEFNCVSDMEIRAIEKGLEDMIVKK